RAGSARGVGRRPRRHAGRRRGAGADARRRRRVSPARRPRRGGASRLHGAARDRAHEPWRVHGGAPRGEAGEVARRDAGEPRQEHRPRARAHALADRARRAPAHGALASRARVPGALRPAPDADGGGTAIPVEWRSGPKEINGQPMPSYIDWAMLTYAFTVVGLPAISVA